MKQLAFITLAMAFLSAATVHSETAPRSAKTDAHLTPADAKMLNIGDAPPEFSLPGIDGKTHTLADYKDAKILVIGFISNHCPDSQAAEGRIKQFVKDVKGKGVAFIAINPNNPEGLREDELGYSKYNDSFEEMKKHADEEDFKFPYLYDGETQRTAKAYGCLATPHVFIFDADRKLCYKGYFDDSRYAENDTVKKPEARNAVDAMLAGKPIAVTETKPHGCSTKWMEKKGSVATEIEHWQKEPVDVELIDAAGVAALRKNGTKKVRLFNVWATWCGPCAAEFPELVKTSRKFGLRDFEFISISLDNPKDKDKVKAFLEKNHATIPNKIKPTLKAEGRTTNSYIFNNPSEDDLIKALDPQWEGPTPYSLLVAPDGSVIWRHDGEVDGEELRAKVLEYMGKYYKPE